MNAPDSKSDIGASLSGVRIPPSPPLPSSWTPDLFRRIETLAAEAGFDRAGLAPAFPSAETPSRFTDFIEQGRAGEMEYLKRRDSEGTLLRTGVPVAVPWARSVLVCALNYNAAGPSSIDPAPRDTGWIARYAWSGKEQGSGDSAPSDYHDDLLSRLRTVEAGLHQLAPCQTRCYVDTGPLLERDLAARAGVGWIGKNTCVLNQALGSWLLLAVIVTSLDLPDEALPLEVPDRCGSCTRCIDACPTDALVAPREMDASLCIAYLTIEKKGTIAEPLRAAMGRQVFGCDICQEVCPWNRKAPIAETVGLTARTELINPELAWLAALDGPQFKRHFRHSPLERTGLKRLHRNVAIAMGNSGDPRFLPRLEEWSMGDNVTLAEAAAWAIEAIRGCSASIG